MKLFTSLLALLLTTAPALAHGGAHSHPHGIEDFAVAGLVFLALAGAVVRLHRQAAKAARR